MKYFFAVLIIIAAYVLFAYARIFYFSHYSHNPKIVQNDTEFGNGPALRYIAAGDSTAVGEGASTVEKTYPYQIAQFLGQTHAVAYKNVAVRGAQTHDIVQSQLQQIIDFKPDIVTISIGANDDTHLVSAAHVLENYKTIIMRLTTETTAQIYITNVPNFTGASLLPWPYIKLLEWRSNKLNPQLAALETNRVKIVNIHDFGWDKFPDRSVTYSLDHFHPSDAGYKNWTDAFLSRF